MTSKFFKSSLLSVATLAAAFTFSQTALAQAAQPVAAMGKGLFEQPGTNSCMYCHGIDGKGGKIAAAVKLAQPKTWRSYKILGGDAEFNKNKAEFMKRFQTAVEHILINGAIVHNARFKQPWYDLSKGGGPFNAQMLGMSGAPSSAWLKRMAARGVTREIAATSLWLHMQSFDTQNVFK